jgi:hypothetical protein
VGARDRVGKVRLGLEPSFSLEIQPSASRRDTARTASGHESQNVVGKGSPRSSTGAFRMTSG